jgi:hypothetical protein
LARWSLQNEVKQWNQQLRVHAGFCTEIPFEGGTTKGRWLFSPTQILTAFTPKVPPFSSKPFSCHEKSLKIGENRKKVMGMPGFAQSSSSGKVARFAVSGPLSLRNARRYKA